MQDNQIINKFSSKAESYNVKATMQKEIACTLAGHLPATEFRRIIDVGCGTGFLAEIIKQKYPESYVLGIDIAPKMIETAKNNVKDVNFRCCSIYDLADLERDFDLVVSSSVLHWINDLPECFSILSGILAPHGFLASAAFVDKSLFELKDSFNTAYENLNIKKKQHVLEFPHSLEIRQYLSEYFEVIFDRQFTYSLYYASAQESVRAIKEIGGNYSYLYNQSFSERKRIFNQMFEHYNKCYKNGTSVRQSWEVLLIGGTKAS